jgi:hypothetical protein
MYGNLPAEHQRSDGRLLRISDYHAITRPLAASAFCQSRWNLVPHPFSGPSKHYPPRGLSERLIPLTSLLLHNHLETECI